jgi:hypothetical protein
MSELKLTAGWLERDVIKAAQQAHDWQSEKSDRSNRGQQSQRENSEASRDKSPR